MVALSPDLCPEPWAIGCPSYVLPMYLPHSKPPLPTPGPCWCCHRFSFFHSSPEAPPRFWRAYVCLSLFPSSFFRGHTHMICSGALRWCRFSRVCVRVSLFPFSSFRAQTYVRIFLRWFSPSVHATRVCYVLCTHMLRSLRPSSLVQDKNKQRPDAMAVNREARALMRDARCAVREDGVGDNASRVSVTDATESEMPSPRKKALCTYVLCRPRTREINALFPLASARGRLGMALGGMAFPSVQAMLKI